MNSTATVAAGFRKASVREAALLLAIAWFVPFAVHLAPWSGPRPLGAYLLPMFWTAFVAVYFYGAGLGLLTGLFGPAVSLLVTGLPAGRMLATMSLELVLFTLLTAMVVRRWPRFLLVAPLGYLAAKAGSTLVEAGALGASWVHAVAGELAGLVILAGINAALVRFYPKAS